MNKALLVLSLVCLVFANEGRSADVYYQAKLIVGGAEVSPKLPDGKEIPEDFYTTNLAILQSAELRTRALERARATEPSIPESDVALRVIRLKETRIFELMSKGTDDAFARVFLNSVLDEFLSSRAEMREVSRNKKLVVMAEDIVTREKAIKERKEKLAQALKGHISMAVLEAEEKRLISALMERRTASTKGENSELKAAEAAVEIVTATIKDVKALQASLDTAEQQYKEKFETVRAFQAVSESEVDLFSILQRASKAEAP